MPPTNTFYHSTKNNKLKASLSVWHIFLHVTNLLIHVRKKRTYSSKYRAALRRTDSCEKWKRQASIFLVFKFLGILSLNEKLLSLNSFLDQLPFKVLWLALLSCKSSLQSRSAAHLKFINNLKIRDAACYF